MNRKAGRDILDGLRRMEEKKSHRRTLKTKERKVTERKTRNTTKKKDQQREHRG